MAEPVTTPITFADPKDPHSGLTFTDSAYLTMPAGASSIVAPTTPAGLEWVSNLQGYEIDRLRRLANDSGLIAGDTQSLTDFVRYLISAIQRLHPTGSGYSMSNYQLAEDIAKLLISVGFGRATSSGYSSPDMTQYATQVDVQRLRNEITKLQGRLDSVHEEINHKDKLWGSF